VSRNTILHYLCRHEVCLITPSALSPQQPRFWSQADIPCSTPCWLCAGAAPYHTPTSISHERRLCIVFRRTTGCLPTILRRRCRFSYQRSIRIGILVLVRGRGVAGVCRETVGRGTCAPVHGMSKWDAPFSTGEGSSSQLSSLTSSGAGTRPAVSPRRCD